MTNPESRSTPAANEQLNAVELPSLGGGCTCSATVNPGIRFAGTCGNPYKIAAVAGAFEC